MFKILLSICSIVSCVCIAMEPKQTTAPSLKELCKIKPEDLKLRMLLPGDESAQQHVVHDFLDRCTDIIESPYGIDVTQLRALCKTTVHALPRADGTGQENARLARARTLLKMSSQSVESGSVTTVTISNGAVQVQSNSPVLSRTTESGVPLVQVTHMNTLNPADELTRLEKLLSGKGRWAKIGALSSSVFVAGMIVGWFYTTKAHYEQNVAHQNGQ